MWLCAWPPNHKEPYIVPQSTIWAWEEILSRLTWRWRSAPLTGWRRSASVHNSTHASWVSHLPSNWYSVRMPCSSWQRLSQGLLWPGLGLFALGGIRGPDSVQILAACSHWSWFADCFHTLFLLHEKLPISSSSLRLVYLISYLGSRPNLSRSRWSALKCSFGDTFFLLSSDPSGQFIFAFNYKGSNVLTV